MKIGEGAFGEVYKGLLQVSLIAYVECSEYGIKLIFSRMEFGVHGYQLPLKRSTQQT